MKLAAFLIFLAIFATNGMPRHPPQTARRPKNDEMHFWLRNMKLYHHFTDQEIVSATGIPDSELKELLEMHAQPWDWGPAAAESKRLFVLPYPGGRHPRIGFLDGAVDPQRETKFSVFCPWDFKSYVLVDVPEAIFSNLGLTYLAHTHVPTIWTKQGITLPPFEWNRRKDGSLDIKRKLPNGIEFGTKVRPGTNVVDMELWLRNGTKELLKDLRVQNCVLFKGVKGFNQQTNDNKLLRKPFAACRNEARDKWIITAWSHCDRVWANPPCPCMHSDPKFPDCPPGKRVIVRGKLWFFEGKDIDNQLERLAVPE